MSCPDDDTLLRYRLGDLTVNETGALTRHLAHCAGCRARDAAQGALLADLRAQPAGASDGAEAFTAKVMAACRASTEEARSPRARRAWPRRVLSLAAAAAVAVGLLAPQAVRDAQAPAGEQWQARGSGSATNASAEIYYARDGVLRPLDGAHLRGGDAIAVRATNTSEHPTYLAVVAIDAAGETHWVFPAYLDPAADPRSVPIAPGTRSALLGELFEPEAPAEGALRVLALVSRTPLTVRQIEAQLAQSAHAHTPLALEETRTHEWRATWNAL